MSDHAPMEASWVEFPSDGVLYNVGDKIFEPGVGERVITRITVQHDEPGLHCNLRRVCIWVGDQLAVEAPMHAVEAVGYPLAKARGETNE